MPPQRNQRYLAIPSARANYDRLCQKHGIIPTPADVCAIKRAIGHVSALNAIQVRFEAALLFFLTRSAVRFEKGSLLIGWVYNYDGRTKQEVWFIPPQNRGRSLYHVPGGKWSSSHSPPKDSSTCDEWHPVISDIVDPNVNKSRIVQYAYFKACIKVLQAVVPPPSITSLRPAVVDSASSSATFILDGPHQEPSSTPQGSPAPSGRRISYTVDLTGSDEGLAIKSEETSAPAPINHKPAPNTQMQEKIQAFREKLDKKEVEELEQMLEKQLPSWIKKLAEDVLQKKMLRELELAESLLL
jgi:hypothetical protein